MFAIDREKASAFVQEYAKISVHKSNKDSRKVVMHLRFLKRSTRTTPSQQIEETFTSGELKQALSQLKAWKPASPDGIAPDLFNNLSLNGSSVLLNILRSS